MLKRLWNWYKKPEIEHWTDFYVEWIEIRVLLPVFCLGWIVFWPYCVVRYGTAGGWAVSGVFVVLTFLFAIIPNIILSGLNLCGWPRRE